jgi:sulfatase-like protein
VRSIAPTLRNGAHLGVLSAFAFAQPLFDILGRNAEFFAARGSSSREIVVFGLALVFLPPAALLLVELLVGLAWPPAARWLHLVFVGLLASLIALEAIKRIGAAPSAVVIGAAIVAAIVSTAAYARSRLVPALLNILAPAPLVFLALFLFATPVSKLVLVKHVTVQTAGARTNTPVVLVVFDELSTVGLLDGRSRIDAVRYPHFAALARDAIWFRNATTVHAHTEAAVPAILTGQLPGKGLLPIYSDHPRNLFTLLGPRYDVVGLEALTRLCPADRCQAGASSPVSGVVTSARAESLVSDAGVVYLHVLLPRGLTGRLPPISDSWTNFRGHEEKAAETELGACGRRICEFTAQIRSTKKPSLFFLHSLLPHVPWQFLPNGSRYGNDVRRTPGLEDARWVNDEWLALQGYQRYLLQLGYTDSALGLVLRRLRETGLYDRALVIVTADHGVSFTPNAPRRVATARNLHEIAFMPLFVKLPRQRSGRIVDSFVRTIDVLPTIADVLGVRSSWRFDGQSVLHALPRDGRVVVRTNVGSAAAPLSSLLPRRRAALARQIAAFGTGSFDHVFRIGPNRELIGKPVASFATLPSAYARADVNGASLLGAVDPQSGLLPCYLTGTIKGARTAREPLAIAINSRIAAVTRTYSALGTTRFTAMIPPAALRPGANALAVYAVRRTGRTFLLELLGGDATALTIEVHGARTVIASAGGTTIRVERGALRGEIRANSRPDSLIFGGWAVDVRARRAADAIVVFRRGSSIYKGSASNYARPGLYRRFGVRQAGFTFELPRSLVGDDLRQIRVFAIRGAVAAELPLER